MIIADTGFWVALGNKNDKYHLTAVEKLSTLSEELITTWPVMTETCHLLLKRMGHISQVKFIENYFHGAFKVFDLKAIHSGQLLKLMDKYKNLPMDLADASLVILAEELGKGQILSTDKRDFGVYRWKNRQPFENILLPD